MSEDFDRLSWFAKWGYLFRWSGYLWREHNRRLPAVIVAVGAFVSVVCLVIIGVFAYEVFS